MKSYLPHRLHEAVLSTILLVSLFQFNALVVRGADLDRSRRSRDMLLPHSNILKQQSKRRVHSSIVWDHPSKSALDATRFVGSLETESMTSRPKRQLQTISTKAPTSSQTATTAPSTKSPSTSSPSTKAPSSTPPPTPASAPSTKNPATSAPSIKSSTAFPTTANPAATSPPTVLPSTANPVATSPPKAPTASQNPTGGPTPRPTCQSCPTPVPTTKPTLKPTRRPTRKPRRILTRIPTPAPTKMHNKKKKKKKMGGKSGGKSAKKDMMGGKSGGKSGKSAKMDDMMGGGKKGTVGSKDAFPDKAFLLDSSMPPSQGSSTAHPWLPEGTLQLLEVSYATLPEYSFDPEDKITADPPKEDRSADIGKADAQDSSINIPNAVFATTGGP